MSRPWLTSSGWLLLLLLVRRRPLEPAHRRDRREQPGQLGVLGTVALDEQRAAFRIEAEGQERGGHLARARPQHVRGRACWSARGSRRCSRSPRTRPAAGRSCGSRPGRCRGGRLPVGWIPEKMRGRASGAPTGAGAGARSVVMARECSRRRSPRRSLRPVGYHSADVATRPHPVMSGARCASASSAREPSGGRSSRALIDRPGGAAAGRWGSPRARPPWPCATSGAPPPRGCPARSCPTPRRTSWPTTTSTSSSS